jgi:hypothetical protein
MNTMRSAWNLARDFTFRPIGKNLFVIQVFCLGDRKKIMEGGPWIFRGCGLMIEEFDGSTTTPTVLPHKVPPWVQIHKVPHRTEAISKQWARRIREEVTVEMKAIPTQKGDFHRVRVNLEANAPLVRFVMLKPEGKESFMIQIKFEKIPRHCTYYGMMGHVYLECGTGEYTEDELQYGEWMLVDESTWRPGTPIVHNSSVEERPGQRNDRAGRATGLGRGGDRQGRGQPPWDTMWRAKKADKGQRKHRRMQEILNGGGSE